MADTLVDRLRKQATCVYLATEKSVADDLSDGLTKAYQEIFCLREVVRGVRIMANAGAFKQWEGEPWLKRVQNIDLES